MVDGEPVVYSTAAIEEENAKLGYEIGAAYPQFEGRAAVVQKLNAAIMALVTREAAAFRNNAKEWAQGKRGGREARRSGVCEPDERQLRHCSRPITEC